MHNVSLRRSKNLSTIWLLGTIFHLTRTFNQVRVKVEAAVSQAALTFAVFNQRRLLEARFVAQITQTPCFVRQTDVRFEKVNIGADVFEEGREVS